MTAEQAACPGDPHLPDDVAADGELAGGEFPGGELSLSGPSAPVDRTRWPVRGDLAHIRLAGRCFVPHYAVPLAYRVVQSAELRPLPRVQADTIAPLTPGTLFDVLDIAGGWVWGQVRARDDDGLVGYAPLSALVPA